MTKGKQHSPNEMRANVKNPNNPAFAKDHGNRGKQMNPNQAGVTKKEPSKDNGPGVGDDEDPIDDGYLSDSDD